MYCMTPSLSFVCVVILCWTSEPCSDNRQTIVVHRMQRGRCRNFLLPFHHRHLPSLPSIFFFYFSFFSFFLFHPLSPLPLLPFLYLLLIAHDCWAEVTKRRKKRGIKKKRNEREGKRESKHVILGKKSFLSGVISHVSLRCLWRAALVGCINSRYFNYFFFGYISPQCTLLLSDPRMINCDGWEWDPGYSLTLSLSPHHYFHYLFHHRCSAHKHMGLRRSCWVEVGVGWRTWTAVSLSCLTDRMTEWPSRSISY